MKFEVGQEVIIDTPDEWPNEAIGVIVKHAPVSKKYFVKIPTGETWMYRENELKEKP